ncbi:MAG: hypothetical protein KBA31_19605 [Alphaproteobacteria bacterium]|nr:hypothetical protein [Alphaproteobacteria bacterium]
MPNWLKDVGFFLLVFAILMATCVDGAGWHVLGLDEVLGTTGSCALVSGVVAVLLTFGLKAFVRWERSLGPADGERTDKRLAFWIVGLVAVVAFFLIPATSCTMATDGWLFGDWLPGPRAVGCVAVSGVVAIVFWVVLAIIVSWSFTE